MKTFNQMNIFFNGDKTPQINKAIEIFTDEIKRRSTIKIHQTTNLKINQTETILVTLEETDIQIEDKDLKLALHTETEDLAPLSTEGYRIVTHATKSIILVTGKDERGVLYGLGKLIRNFEIFPDKIILPHQLKISSSPYTSLRGHQLGHRPKTNAYDMWSKDQYRQYIRELALFGANAIELLPPRTDDEPRTPEMLYDQLELMSWLSTEISEIGLSVWIWYPNMNTDFSLPDVIREESKERDEIFSALPHIDAVMIPGGDPGHQEPSVLFKWGQIQSEILKKHHPQAEIWISAQVYDSTASWVGSFFQELGKNPTWLGGVCHGPWVQGNLTEFRARVPEQYPIRRYPDITHSLSAQYPVRDWDPAFAATLGRECYNPRPLDYKKIHNAYVDSASGSLSYSEGINDDVNKFVWSDQDWDPKTSVKDTLRDYARLFISPNHVEQIAEGILGLERNWRGPIASNTDIYATHSIWKSLEHELPDETTSNYRLVMPMMRSYFDEYIRRRLHFEKGVEEQVITLIENLSTDTSSERIAQISETIQQKLPQEISYLKERCTEHADRAFDLIRWQTSVTRHKGQAIVRGCFLDAIDFPISDLPFFLKTLNEVTDPSTFHSVLSNALHRSRPSTRGHFLNLNSVEDKPEVIKASDWDKDPSGLSLPFTVNVAAPHPNYEKPGEFSNAKPLVPIVERSFASTFYEKPLRIRFTELNPLNFYQLSACYVTSKRWGGLKLEAGNKVLIHDWILPEDPYITVNYQLPKNCISSDGTLDLFWYKERYRVYGAGVAWVALEAITG